MTEREQFELIYASVMRLPIDRTISDERYCSMETEHAWRAWQVSRRAALEDAIAKLMDELKEDGAIEWKWAADVIRRLTDGADHAN